MTLMHPLLRKRRRLRVMPSRLFQNGGKFVPRPPPWPSWNSFVLARRSRCVLFTFFPIRIHCIVVEITTSTNVILLFSFPLHLPPIIFLFYACLSTRTADVSASMWKNYIEKIQERWQYFTDRKLSEALRLPAEGQESSPSSCDGLCDDFFLLFIFAPSCIITELSSFFPIHLPPIVEGRKHRPVSSAPAAADRAKRRCVFSFLSICILATAQLGRIFDSSSGQSKMRMYMVGLRRSGGRRAMSWASQPIEALASYSIEKFLARHGGH